MGSLILLFGAVLAGYAGYAQHKWYFIFISSSIMAVGYFIIRAPQIHGIASRDGSMALPKLFLTQTVFLSVITAPVFFITAAFG